jgi:hypothetical protein
LTIFLLQLSHFQQKVIKSFIVNLFYLCFNPIAAPAQPAPAEVQPPQQQQQLVPFGQPSNHHPPMAMGIPLLLTPIFCKTIAPRPTEDTVPMHMLE